MIDEGEGAPAFELPAVVGGEIERVALADFLGSNVVILAFYPADFNPACDDGETDLDELDLFTMQKDVSILAVSGDSVYSHRAFADEYDLNIPLLSDTTGEVAADYGVAVEDADAGYLTERAVVVIGPGGDIEYAWSTSDLRQLPPVEHVREAVDDVGGAETAVARYRVGHAHYVEGRRAFTSAMGCFGDNEWMMAQSDFMRAKDEFEEAAAQFNTAVRFGEDADSVAYFERAEDKSELLWQAAEWLAGSASAYASGEGAEGQSMREDAETPLEEARRYGEPLEPDNFPPDEPPAPLETVDEEREYFLPDDEEEVDTTLDVDIDEDAYADEDLRESVDGQDTDQLAAEGAATDGEGTVVTEGGVGGEASPGENGGPEPDEAGSSTEETDEGDDEEDESSIDESELEEITAELEQQTEVAKAHEEREEGAEEENVTDDGIDEPGGDDAADEPGDDKSDESGDADGEGEDDVELELTDPTDGKGLEPLEDADEGDVDEGDADEGDADEEDDEDEGNVGEDLGGGGHGVPDSL